MPILIPARFPSGLAVSRNDTDLLGRYAHSNPLYANYYENDFNTYAAADWTVAPATGTSALTAALGGALLLTTGAVSGNGQGNALTPVSFAFTPGYQTWFAIGFTVTGTNQTLANWIFGLTAGGANAPTSGVYFTKATAVLTVNGVLNKGGTTTTLTSITTAPSGATSFSLGIFYDGRPTSNLYFYSSAGLTGGTGTPSPTAYGQVPIYGGTRVASASNDGINVNPLTNLPTVNLQPSFFIQTNAASAATLQVDYVVAACEVLRF